MKRLSDRLQVDRFRAIRKAGPILPAAALVFAAMGVVGEAVAKNPVSCGGGYVVERGDTLFKIAKRAYGDGKRYKEVFRANTDLLPSDAAIEIGDELFLPCFGGDGPQTRKDAIALGLLKSETTVVASAIAETDKVIGNTEAHAAVAVGTRVVTIEQDTAHLTEINAAGDGTVLAVSAPGLGMLAGEGLISGGVITDLLDRAATTTGSALRPDFVGNRVAHLDLLARGDFEIGYPWVRPDCDGGSTLDPVSRRLCDEFTFSAPILELSVAFFVAPRAGKSPPRSHAELAGLRICRTENTFPLSLVVPGQPETTHNASAMGCFVELLRGTVDLVAVERAAASEIIAKINSGGVLIEELQELGLSRTVHAIAPTGRASAVDALARINGGLGVLMASGKWFEIIVAHR